MHRQTNNNFSMSKTRSQTVKFLKQLVKVIQDEVYFSDQDFLESSEDTQWGVQNYLKQKIINFFKS